jgi:hypothetical protein
VADEVHVRAWRKKRAAFARRLPVPCGVCGILVRPGDVWHLSHVKARSLGGSAADGLFVAHERCNLREAPRLAWIVRQRQSQTRNAAPSRDWSGSPKVAPEPAQDEPSRIF